MWPRQDSVAAESAAREILGEELGPTDQRPKQVRSVLEKWVNLGYTYI